jgi:SpoVK/Ycf46/Vps4 family AAA+-type ATPase
MAKEEKDEGESGAQGKKHASSKASGGALTEADFIRKLELEHENVFGALVQEKDLSDLTPQQLPCVLEVLYDKYRCEATKPIKLDDDVREAPLRAAYKIRLYNQDVFDLVVCSTLLSQAEMGNDFVKSEKIPYAFTTHLHNLNDIKKEFNALGSHVEAANENSPKWIADCVGTFGKKALGNWIEAQKKALDRTIFGVMHKKHLDDIKCQDDALAIFEVEDYSAVTVDEAFKRLNRLVGLDEIKEEMHSIDDSKLLEDVREEIFGRGGRVPPKTFDFENIVLTGMPGVGKTTSATLIAGVVLACDLAPKKKLILSTASKLIGRYTGYTETNIEVLFELGKGGVIVVDEVDNLFQGEDGTNFHKGAIDTLNTLIGHAKESGTVVIFTGYPARMEALLNSNPGLDGRFPIRFALPAYDDPALEKIFQSMITERGYSAEEGVSELVMQRVSTAKDQQGERFQNARAVELIVAQMQKTHARNISPLLRLIKSGEQPLDEKTKHKVLCLTKEDVPIFDQQTKTFKKPGAARPDSKASNKADLQCLYI